MSSHDYRYGAGSGAKWHPPRAIHMLRGELVAWLYTLTLLDAIYMLQEALAAGKTEEVINKEVSMKLEELQPAMPHPKRCGNLCKTRPLCYTNYMPHYNPDFTLEKAVVGTHNWTVEDPGYGEWSLTYGYLDNRVGYRAMAGRASGELHLRLKVGKDTIVWICGNNQGESLKHAEFFLDTNVSESRMANYTPGVDRVQWHHKKYVGDECKALHNIPEGVHVMSVITSANKTEHVSAVTHVITWE
eukprot:gene10810-22557_t